MIKLEIKKPNSVETKEVTIEKEEGYYCDFCVEDNKPLFSAEGGHAVCEDCVKQLNSFIKSKNTTKKVAKKAKK